MRLNKQTVYLPVNVLDETSVIVTNQGANTLLDKVKRQEGYFFTPEQLNEYTANVIKDALNTAAEKATLLENGELTYFGRYIIEEGNHYSETEIDVSKESITITFEETFQKYKV